MARAIFVALLAYVTMLPVLFAQTPRAGVLWQNMPLIALLNGDYTADVTAEKAVTYGDTGLGAFANLDGEMVAVDGKIYRVRSDGKVTSAAANDLLAFAQMIAFHPDRKMPIPPNTSLDTLAAVLSSEMPAPNSSYGIRISGSFVSIDARAPHSQHEPFPPFCEVQKSQAVFHLRGVEGTMVGFAAPAYLSILETTPFHFHFVARDLASGGHVLAFQTKNATAELQLVNRMQVDFPQSAGFAKTPLARVITCP